MLAGCSQDFAQRQFHGLLSRGLRLEIADIREGCSWVHQEDAGQVTDKARRLIHVRWRIQDRRPTKRRASRRMNTVLVIGGGVAGTQTAVEMARMGHAVELVEQRPFLGGRGADRRGVFPPTIAASACRRRTPRPARASASIATSPSTTPTSISGAVAVVESVSGRAGDFKVALRQLPNIVTTACIELRHLRDGLPPIQQRRDGQGDLRGIL